MNTLEGDSRDSDRRNSEIKAYLQKPDSAPLSCL